MTDLQPSIEHNLQSQCFLLSVEQHQAKLAYKITHNSDGSRTVDFFSTYVPPEFRGKGYAERLVRHGLKWAREENLWIEASCWYVQKFLPKENQ